MGIYRLIRYNPTQTTINPTTIFSRGIFLFRASLRAKVRATSTTLASDHGIQQKTDGNRWGAKQKPRCPVAQQRGSRYMVARWSLVVHLAPVGAGTDQRRLLL